MTSALDEIAFLANSENRVAVLQALATAPRARHELLEELDSSRVTLSRVLRDFESRNWVERETHTYHLTPLGEWIATEFTNLLEMMEAQQRLREVVSWLPTEYLTFDVQCFENAEIIYATESDPMAPIRRAENQLRSGTRLRILSTQVVASFFEILRDTVVSGPTTFEGVATPSVYETITHDSYMAHAFEEVCDADDATFYVSEDVPLILHIVDEEVLLGLTDDAQTPRAGIITTDGSVYDWAVETFETQRERADPVTRETATEVREESPVL
jgi:predicted transcriptional regulator